MATFTIYGDASDFWADRQGGSYTGIRTQAGTFAAADTDSTVQLGEVRNAESTQFYSGQVFLLFDTSTLTGTVTAASINFTTANYDHGPATQITPSGTQTIEAAYYTWVSAAASEYRTTSALGALTLFGSGAQPDTQNTAYAITGSDFSELTASSALKFVAFAQNHRISGAIPDGSRPATWSADASGTSTDPYLSITTIGQDIVTVHRVPLRRFGKVRLFQ